MLVPLLAQKWPQRNMETLPNLKARTRAGWAKEGGNNLLSGEYSPKPMQEEMCQLARRNDPSPSVVPDWHDDHRPKASKLVQRCKPTLPATQRKITATAFGAMPACKRKPEFASSGCVKYEQLGCKVLQNMYQQTRRRVARKHRGKLMQVR